MIHQGTDAMAVGKRASWRLEVRARAEREREGCRLFKELNGKYQMPLERRCGALKLKPGLGFLF